MWCTGKTFDSAYCSKTVPTSSVRDDCLLPWSQGGIHKKYMVISARIAAAVAKVVLF